jgi:hypothetical protein
MYLALNNVNEEQKDKVRQFLNNENIDHEDYLDALELFCYVEAHFRVDTLIKEEGIELDPDDTRYFKDEVGAHLYNNNTCILDNDYISDVIDDIKKEFVKISDVEYDDQHIL